MAISSVSSSSNAVPNPQLVQASAAPEEPVKVRQAREEERKPEPPKPVVNDRGESTGKVINTSA